MRNVKARAIRKIAKVRWDSLSKEARVKHRFKNIYRKIKQEYNRSFGK